MPGQFFKSSVSPLKTISEVLLKLPRGLEAELRERVKGFVCWFRKRKVAQRLKEEVSHYTYSLLLLTGCILIYLLFPRDWASCATLFGALLTVYVAFYAIAWAKYEFHITRQSQQMSVLAALCSTEKRKEFAPALAEMTRKKLPRHPTLFKPGIIFASLCAAPDDRKYLTEANPDINSIAASLLLGFKDWKDADLRGLTLPKANLSGIHLEGAALWKACFDGSTMSSCHMESTSLEGASLKGTRLQGGHLNETSMMQACLKDADLRKAVLDFVQASFTTFTNAHLQMAHMQGAFMHRCDFTKADLESSYLVYTYFKISDLTEANLKNAIFGKYKVPFFKDEEKCFCVHFDDALLTRAVVTPMRIQLADSEDCRVIDDSTTDEQDLVQCASILSTAKTLYLAKLPAPVEALLRRDHPRLFEKPPGFKEA